MTARKQKSDGEKSPERLAFLARKASQADEGRIAMAEYQRGQQATLDRTAKLRALRLAQEAGAVQEKPPVKRKKKAVP